MDKMDEKTPNFEFPNHSNQNDSPIGYPDMSGKLPQSYAKLNPPDRKYVYHTGPLSHSVNPERHKYAAKGEMQRMKLAK